MQRNVLRYCALFTNASISSALSAYTRLTRFFLRLVRDANDFCGGGGEPVKNHKRILANDKLPVGCGFQLGSDFRVVGYLQNGFADLMPDPGGDGWPGCFDVILGDAPQVALSGCEILKPLSSHDAL